MEAPGVLPRQQRRRVSWFTRAARGSAGAHPDTSPDRRLDRGTTGACEQGNGVAVDAKLTCMRAHYGCPRPERARRTNQTTAIKTTTKMRPRRQFIGVLLRAFARGEVAA